MHGKTRQGNTKHDKARQDNIIKYKTIQYKIR